MKKSSSSGFTLIELIVVIVILGILAATALPRFINLQDVAHKAAVEGTAGSLSSGLNLVRAQHEVVNRPGMVEIKNKVFSFKNGNAVNDWPVGDQPLASSGATTASGCVALFDGLLETGPKVATSGEADYIATVEPGKCVYNYVKDTSEKKAIVYDIDSGSFDVVMQSPEG